MDHLPSLVLVGILQIADSSEFDHPIAMTDGLCIASHNTEVRYRSDEHGEEKLEMIKLL